VRTTLHTDFGDLNACFRGLSRLGTQNFEIKHHGQARTE
jgi:hypothetical protein